MKIRLLLLSAIFVFLMSLSKETVWAKAVNISSQTPIPTNVEYPLPYPGILPDHPLYLLKRIRDSILELATQKPEAKVHLYLLFSDKHVSMGQILWEKKSYTLAVKTVNEGEKHLLTASRIVVSLGADKNLPPGLSDKAELAGKKHKEVINKLIAESTDESIKMGLTQDLGITQQAIQQIASTK